jgi:hypothetical protein
MKRFLKGWGGWVLLALGIVFIFIGIFRGEPGLILQKAIRICLECIGIG